MNPAPVPSASPGGPDRACAVCSSTALTRGRLVRSEPDPVELLACERCGEFWFERNGMRLTSEAMRDLGFSF